jgi:hypothetical protein
VGTLSAPVLSKSSPEIVGWVQVLPVIQPGGFRADEPSEDVEHVD